MRKLIFILSFFPLLAFGQPTLEWFESSTANFKETSRSQSMHSSIHPYLIRANTYQISMYEQTKSIPYEFQRFPLKKWILLPMTDIGFRGEKTGQYRTMIGAGLEANLNSKWYARMSYMHGIENARDFFVAKNTLSYSIDSLTNQKIDLRGRVSYSPNRFVNLQAGWDNQFIGEGNRSLFLSDYGKPHGFGLARLNFWNLEYLMMYQFLQEKNTQNQRISKFASSHYLSYNITKWLQMGIFESVVFQPKDSLLNRGFEPEYLNPMIFYRPQEYALGSADNVLIGIDAKIRIKKFTLYGQLMMDEFNLADIKGRTRWWANKYAVQMGVKTNFSIQNHSFFARGEMNIVRPYTYSHLSNAQSYTNQGDPLAHPYGANFSEILAEANWTKNKWKAGVFAAYSLKGYDTSVVNWGGNINIPYINRPVELNDFGHTIGQGKGNNAFRVMLRGSYRLYEKSRIDAFVEGHFRYNTYLNEPKAQIVIGIRSQLWNDYRNY